MEIYPGEIRLPCSPVNIKVSVFNMSYRISANMLKNQSINGYAHELSPNSYSLKSTWHLTLVVVVANIRD